MIRCSPGHKSGDNLDGGSFASTAAATVARCTESVGSFVSRIGSRCMVGVQVDSTRSVHNDFAAVDSQLFIDTNGLGSNGES